MATFISAAWVARVTGIAGLRITRSGWPALALSVIFFLVSGCSYTSIGARNADRRVPPETAFAADRLAPGSAEPVVDVGQAAQVQQDAELRAGLLARAMGDYSTARDIAPPEVRWIDPGSAGGEAATRAAIGGPSVVGTGGVSEKPVSITPQVVDTRRVDVAPPKSQGLVAAKVVDTRLSGRRTAGPSTGSRQDLFTTGELDYDELTARVRALVLASDGPEMRKALASAGVSLLDPEGSFDPESLGFLSASEREQVRRYQQLIVELGRRLTDGDGSLDPEAVLEDLGRVLGERPIAISRLKLCGRVSGFGVYDELPDATILAGREQPVIVYAELDDFRAVKAGDGGYRVSLHEEVELYNDADGLVVWRQPQVEVTDNSRNRRRDFFVVQLIRLPAQLSVGKYQLKVRITDKANGSSDEATVPIQVVADQALVAQGLR